MGRRIYCPPRRRACPDGGGTTPDAKFRHAPVLPPEILRDARANVSRQPFPRARQCSLPVWAAYKSGRRSPGLDTKNPLPAAARQNLPARPLLVMAPTGNTKWTMLREFALACFLEDAEVVDAIRRRKNSPVSSRTTPWRSWQRQRRSCRPRRRRGSARHSWSSTGTRATSLA
jgi:hypothetical protein